MKHASARPKLLLQKFPQYVTDFIFFTDEKVSSVASPDNWQNKVSGRQWELLKKLTVFFSAGTAWFASAWPPLNCACVPQLFEQLTLTPCFVQLFSGNVSVNLFAVYPFKYKLLSKSCPRRKHCSDVCCDEFSMPKIGRNLNK